MKTRSKYKVVIISPAHPYRGGQVLDEVYLYKTLTEKGFDCTTITFTLLYPSFLFPGKTQYENSKNIPFEHQDKIFRIINTLNPLSWWKAFRKVKALKADIVIFNWWMPFLGICYYTIIFLIKKLYKKCKVTFLIDNFLSHEGMWFDKILAKIAFSNVDAFICQSSYIFGQVKKYYPYKKIYKNTLSVYKDFGGKGISKIDARKKIGLQKNTKVILFFGLIRPYKGLDILVKAFPNVLKKYPRSELLIAGECYEDIKMYHKLIANLGIKNKVIMHDTYIPNEEIEAYYTASDIVCMPYRSATQSGIMMIALGYKKAVVATNVGGLAELIIPEKNGMIVKEPTPEHLSQGLIDAFQKIHFTEVEKHINKIIQKIQDTGIDKIVLNILHQD